MPQRITALLDRLSERLETATSFKLVALLGAACMLTSIWFNKFGCLHLELWTYVPYHLGPGSIFKKIFDSTTFESGTYYQGRELSYLVDHVDVLIMAETARLGFPCFISTFHIVASIVIGVAVCRFCARDLKLGKFTGLLLAALFWTAPYIFIHSIFRSSKIGASLFSVWLAIELYRALAPASPAATGLPRSSLRRIFVLSLITSLFDRQGLYLIGVLIVMSLLGTLGANRRAGLTACASMAAAIAVNAVYFFFVAPTLTFAFFNYQPSLDFNKLPFDVLFADPRKYFDAGCSLYVDTFRFLAGDPSSFAAIIVLAALLMAAAVVDRRRLLPGFLIVTVLTIVMYALMYLRHPPVVWPDVRRIYYWMPSGALMVVGLALVLSGIVERRLLSRPILQLVLLCALAGNIVAIPAHRHIVDIGHLRDILYISPRIRTALEHVHDPNYQVPADVAANHGYQALRDYALR